MKRQILSNVLVFAALCVFAGCASTGDKTDANLSKLSSTAEGALKNLGSFSDVFGHELKLVKVYIESEFSREIIFDRAELNTTGFGDILTLNFDAEMVSGVGSPNRYSAPYTVQGQTLKINLIRSTMMASILQQPERLPEHEFFGYMQNVYEWGVNSGRLELRSKNENDQEVRLIFE